MIRASDVSLLHRVQTDPGVHAAFYRMGTGSVKLTNQPHLFALKLISRFSLHETCSPLTHLLYPFTQEPDGLHFQQCKTLEHGSTREILFHASLYHFNKEGSRSEHNFVFFSPSDKRVWGNIRMQAMNSASNDWQNS
jgi:hypothetical protein